MSSQSEIAINVVAECQARGFEILVYCMYRSPEDQARAYRRSRTTKQIAWKAGQLTERGFPDLAAVLMVVGPQRGPLGRHITNAGPGESWHQYDEAFDAVPVVGGKLLWDIEKSYTQWQMYRDAVVSAGMYSGASFDDWPHAQMRIEGNPLDVLTPAEVERMLMKSEGGNEA